MINIFNFEVQFLLASIQKDNFFTLILYSTMFFELNNNKNSLTLGTILKILWGFLHRHLSAQRQCYSFLSHLYTSYFSSCFIVLHGKPSVMLKGSGDRGQTRLPSGVRGLPECSRSSLSCGKCSYLHRTMIRKAVRILVFPRWTGP